MRGLPKFMKWAIGSLTAVLGSATLLLMIGTGVYVVDPSKSGSLTFFVVLVRGSFTATDA